MYPLLSLLVTASESCSEESATERRRKSFQFESYTYTHTSFSQKSRPMSMVHGRVLRGPVGLPMWV